jgi:hypothetical protein
MAKKPNRQSWSIRSALRRERLDKRIGRLEDVELIRLNQSIAVFLGLAD